MIEARAVIASASERPATRAVLERAAVLHRRAAVILRANGMWGEAARAEQFAARTRLTVDEPVATRRMNELAWGLYESSHTTQLLERALDGAISLIGGEFGNLQLRDPADGALRIAAQSGFEREFLEYFAIVEDDASACGRAAHQRSQAVIVDVNEDAAFARHREIAAASRFRAVQSTPLVDPAGRLHGVISTHFRRPYRPSKRDLELMQWFAENVATALAEREEHLVALVQGTDTLHARTVRSQEAAAIRIEEGAAASFSDWRHPDALAIQDRAQRALERARRERERAHALAGKVQTLSAHGLRNPSIATKPLRAVDHVEYRENGRGRRGPGASEPDRLPSSPAG